MKGIVTVAEADRKIPIAVVMAVDPQPGMEATAISSPSPSSADQIPLDQV